MTADEWQSFLERVDLSSELAHVRRLVYALGAIVAAQTLGMFLLIATVVAKG